MKKILTVKNLTIKFPSQNKPVFEKISFSVTKNTIFGIFGETGCGKSTLAKCLTGFLPREYISGEIWLESIALHSQSLTDYKHKILGDKIVYVPQDPYQTLNPHETLATQLKRVLSLARNPQTIEEIIEHVKLPIEKTQISPTLLSAGQRQRGTIALALARKPQVILFDEPTASLDKNTRKELLGFFVELTQKKICTILVISHEFNDYDNLIDPQNRLYFNPPQDSKSQVFLSQTSDENLLQMMNVKKSYQKFCVLQNIDLLLKKGEWIYLHGQNGCGKTTLIHTLSGLHTIDKGKIFWENHDISLKPFQKHMYIHIVFQDSFYSFHPRYTVRQIWDEVIFCSPHQKQLSDFCNFWQQVLEVPDTTLGSTAKQISYGQQKRVSLLRTLLKYYLYHLQFPEKNHLFLLDEVFAGIHLHLRYKIIQNIQQLYQEKQNFSIIWIAHGQDNLQDFCHKSYLLRNGMLKMTHSNLSDRLFMG